LLLESGRERLSPDVEEVIAVTYEEMRCRSLRKAGFEP
jgi:hypothetical protein